MTAAMPAPARLMPLVGEPLAIERRELRLGLRSRLILLLLRLFLKPFLARMVRRDYQGIARAQLQVAGLPIPDKAGQPIAYDVIGQVAGHVVGTLKNTGAPVLLWLHGGAFVLPAAPTMHLPMVAKLCRDLGASGFVPDYRLAPFNRFPAGLDDCERAYRALLALGHQPGQIVLGGDSAGGNLLFGVLQRIRIAGLPMPACAVALSPATEMGRIHGPPSRYLRQRDDVLLPIASLQRIDDLYAGDWDASDPQLSPLYMDCEGLPPLLFMAGEHEVLSDDAVMLARRTHAAGVTTVCQVWSGLPHAFPLFESWFPEVRPARDDIAAFARRHLQHQKSSRT